MMMMVVGGGNHGGYDGRVAVARAGEGDNDDGGGGAGVVVAAVRTSLAVRAGFCLGRNHPFLWSVLGACCRRLGWPEGPHPVCFGGADGGIAWPGLDCLCR